MEHGVTFRSFEVQRRFISLGQFTVAVETSLEHDSVLEALGAMGNSDLDHGLIRIHSSLELLRRREVIMHELLHHVIHLTHLAARWDDDETEEVIRALSPWLTQAVHISNID